MVPDEVFGANDVLELVEVTVGLAVGFVVLDEESVVELDFGHERACGETRTSIKFKIYCSVM